MRSGLRAIGALRPDGQANDEPVALETPVVATGARPGGSGDKRQLFSEETQAVLIFEKGAVIRLSAAVADGQLLFLTNKKTGKEVVTQVVRKRSFRPTSCYVDLEFTEACPRFWGIEFPKAAPTTPANSSASLSEDEEPGTSPTAPAAPPDLQEVERLKKEVAALQTQLTSLAACEPTARTAKEASSSPSASIEAPKKSAIAHAAPAPSAPGEMERSAELPRREAEEKMLERLFAQEVQQEQLPAPKRLVSYSQKSPASSVMKKTSKAAIAGVLVTVVVAAGLATYYFGLLDRWVGNARSATPAPSQAAAVAATDTVQKSLATAPPTAALPNTPAESISMNPVNDNKGLPATDKGIATTSGLAEPVPPNEANPARTYSDATASPKAAAPKMAVKDSKPNVGRSAAGLAAISAAPAAQPSVASESRLASASPSDDFVGPKLVRAVKPVSPTEALRNYVTGNVNVDALVDTTGHVKSVTVLSGPPKLRKTAVEVMKQYVYEPARKNGKPVPSHVQTSLQFWYEP